MTRAVLTGLRRFAVLVVIAVVVTAVVSGILAAAPGQPVRRSVTVGLYVVGSVFMMMGFFVGEPAAGQGGRRASGALRRAHPGAARRGG